MCCFFFIDLNERWSSMSDVIFSSSCSYAEVSSLSCKMNVFIFVVMTIHLSVSWYCVKLLRGNIWFFVLWSYRSFVWFDLVNQLRDNIAILCFFSNRIVKIVDEMINVTSGCFSIDRYVSSCDWDFELRKMHEIHPDIEIDGRYLISIYVFPRYYENFIHDMERITFQIPISTLTHGLRYCKYRAYVVDPDSIVEYLIDDIFLIHSFTRFFSMSVFDSVNFFVSSIKSFIGSQNQKLISKSIELNSKSWS